MNQGKVKDSSRLEQQTVCQNKRKKCKSKNIRNIIVLNVQKQFDQYSCQVPVLVSETTPSTPAECKSSQPVERVSYLLLD